jgi:protein-disulfide isomerase
VYRDLPLADIHPGAVLAAHVANCAADQGAFWPMYERIFLGTERGEWGDGSQQDYAVMLGYAAELQLDDAEMRACVEGNRHQERIATDVQFAIENGINSTPSFLINGRPFIGAQTFTQWKRVLDRILATP